MSRTNIDLDDTLVNEVMRRFGVTTKREAVDLALRRLVGPRITDDVLADVKGVGWDADLSALRDHQEH